MRYNGYDRPYEYSQYPIPWNEASQQNVYDTQFCQPQPQPQSHCCIPGPRGPIGPIGPTGPTGPSALEIDPLATSSIGTINRAMDVDEGGGVSQAVGALVFNGNAIRTVTEMAAYVIQDGNGTGSFQMAILRPTSVNQATVVAVTTTASSIVNGIFILPLTSHFALAANTTYYLAVFNQVLNSRIGAVTAGTIPEDAPPINFRVQNLVGFSVGQTISTTDTSMTLTPWLAAI
jgi:hypothetical protein